MNVCNFLNCTLIQECWYLYLPVHCCVCVVLTLILAYCTEGWNELQPLLLFPRVSCGSVLLSPWYVAKLDLESSNWWEWRRWGLSPCCLGRVEGWLVPVVMPRYPELAHGHVPSLHVASAVSPHCYSLQLHSQYLFCVHYTRGKAF